jgi:formamidopyrimidine-DNA glycosylase
MDGKIVVGVGNIYASEALFMAKINPAKSAKKISLAKYKILAQQIKQVLANAIKAGGTTLKDFINADGKPGYFAQQLNVYGRTGKPCLNCSQPIKQVTIGQRSTFYCGKCQR